VALGSGASGAQSCGTIVTQLVTQSVRGDQLGNQRVIAWRRSDVNLLQLAQAGPGRGHDEWKVTNRHYLG
jgi:hypothetical protein